MTRSGVIDNLSTLCQKWYRCKNVRYKIHSVKVINPNTFAGFAKEEGREGGEKNFFLQP